MAVAKPSFQVVTRSVASGETLYNGIQLPTTWPPLDVELYSGGTFGALISRAPIQTPYVTAPPASRIIRTSGGVGGRQLFVDDWLIKNKSSNLTRTWYKPTGYAGNPVLSPSEAWEVSPGLDDTYSMPFSGGVNYDPADDTYKAHYYGGKFQTCYATSADGRTWTKPNLGLYGATNIVYDWEPEYADTGHDSDTVWMDLNEADPNKKWKMATTVLVPGVSWHQDLHYSADGQNWGAKVGQTGQIIDRTTFHYNPFRSKWVWGVRDFQGPPSNPRYRRYWEQSAWDTGSWTFLQNYFIPQVSTQPVMWSRTTTATPSRHDSIFPSLDVDAGGVPVSTVPTQLYNMDAAPYESLMVFLLAQLDCNPIYNGRPKINELYIAFSRDGFHFTYGNDYAPWINASTVAQSWNWGNVQSCSPCVQVDNGELLYPVNGRSGLVGVGLESGICSMGLYTQRRDGFCSMKAPSGAGELTLTTERVRFYSGTKFYVNAKPTGSSPQLRVEAINEPTGAVITNFARSNSSVVSTDTTAAEVTFGAAISTLQGEPVSFKFYIQDMELFSFWIADDSGGSGGYIHQGRP